jgi:integrase
MSEGWTARGIYDRACEYKANLKAGKKPTSWKEEQRINAEKARIEEAQRKGDLLRTISFKDYFEKHYLPSAEANKKPETIRKEKEHVTNWIHPVTGDLPMKDIALAHVKRLQGDMAKAKKSPRTQQYVLRTFNIVWNAALDEGIVSIPCPTHNKSFKLPRVDNERKRYLTYEEADQLLDAVRAQREQAADMALTSLEAGLRFGEVAALTWGCVDLKAEILHVLRTKGGKDRTVPMSKKLKDRLTELNNDQSASDLVFPNRSGEIHSQVPTGFKKGLKDSGINDGVTDPKLKASFHTLRHTFASRLVQAGVDLHTVQVLLGHATPAVTQRYSHLRQDDLRDALNKAERAAKIEQQKGKVIDLNKAKAQGQGE